MSDLGVSFAATFFDAPGLLAVRFARQRSNRVVSFATERRPDVEPPGWFGGFGGILGVGLAVAVIGGLAVNSCSQTAAPAQVASPAAPRRAMPVISDALDLDSSESRAWPALLTGLADDFSPTREDLRPWAVRTLLEVPRELGLRGGDATGGWLRPRCAAAERSAFESGKQLAELLRETGSGPEVAVILDLAGPSAIAAAAGLARDFEPIVTFDNLPHAAGVVPSAQTLAAVVYWRPTVVAARADRAPTAAPLFVLEGTRLAPYHNQPDRFDNRSRARLPDAAGFPRLGIARVLYIRERPGEVAERDDLNTLFCELSASGIEVRHLALGSLASVAAATAEARNRWFWARYGWHQPGKLSLAAPDDPDARYRSTPRQTVFSAKSQAVFDGGEREHATIVSGLAKQEDPPPATVSSSSSSHGGGYWGGGSWSRSSGSHHYG